MASKDIIEISPSAMLTFQRPFQSTVKETLTIKNTGTEFMAFKVKTTAPRQYCVRPNSAVIAPGDTKQVQVLLQPMKEDPPLDYKCKDKFLVQYATISETEVDIAFPDLWASVEQSRKSDIGDKKLKCQYLPASKDNNVDLSMASTDGKAPPSSAGSKVTFREDSKGDAVEVEELRNKIRRLEKTCDEYQRALATAISKGGSGASSVTSATNQFSVHVVIVAAFVAFLIGFWFR